MKRYWVLMFAVLFFSLTVPLTAEVEVTLLQETFTRTAGAPDLFIVEFPGIPGTATLRLVNGDASSLSDLPSGVIVNLSPIPCFGPSSGPGERKRWGSRS